MDRAAVVEPLNRRASMRLPHGPKRENERERVRVKHTERERGRESSKKRKRIL